MTRQGMIVERHSASLSPHLPLLRMSHASTCKTHARIRMDKGPTTSSYLSVSLQTTRNSRAHLYPDVSPFCVTPILAVRSSIPATPSLPRVHPCSHFGYMSPFATTHSFHMSISQFLMLS